MVSSEPAFARWQLADSPQALDLRDRQAVTALVAGAAPDAVLHLAAQSWVPEAVRDPEATLHINVLGTLHLLQALKQAGFRGRMVFVGTGDVYGRVPDSEMPISETRLPAPRNPYAVSKLAAEALCYQWSVSEGMEIVLARPFNHIGWGQSDRFVMSDFARQISEIKQGRRAPAVTVGDIDVSRDFTRRMQAAGPLMSWPITPVVRLMITPGQASRIASTMAAATSGSHDGRCPLPGSCWRRCTCMMAAPALKETERFA